MERQQQKLQGFGRPIIAENIRGKRAVTEGSLRYLSTKFRTFHDFLGFYIHEVLKGKWAPDEWKKPRLQRHLLLTHLLKDAPDIEYLKTLTKGGF